MYKQNPQVCKKLQHLMASNQWTGFESLSSGLCACSFWWDTIYKSSCWLLVTRSQKHQSPWGGGGGAGEIAQPYGPWIHLSNANLECANVNYICFITGINMWHKDECVQATHQMASVIGDNYVMHVIFSYFPVFTGISQYFPVFPTVPVIWQPCIWKLVSNSTL